MKKRVLIWQICISIILLSLILLGKNIENDKVQKGYSFVMSQVMKNVTVDDVKSTSKEVIRKFKASPGKLVNAVITANNQSAYASPIDEKSSSNVKQVHSVAGGMVFQVGNNKELGLFVKIKHEKKVSIYGHLSDINVVPKERVQRGEIIGAFNTKCGEEFYYLLDNDL